MTTVSLDITYLSGEIFTFINEIPIGTFFSEKKQYFVGYLIFPSYKNKLRIIMFRKINKFVDHRRKLICFPA